MPFLLYMLALAVFAQGTSEFMLAGLLPAVSADLGVSTPQAGLLTSSFAVGMVVGAPVVAVLGRRWSPRWTLTGLLGLFTAAHVVGALTDDFCVLLATRVAAALANAGFLAVALAVVAAVVPAGLRARGLPVVLGGTTLALVA
ncbi:MFS transporter, partial [Nocardiopsis sp. CC223A]|uniref:MFS transporter n=1 Tax=Nocardiopsis sp. CC223A TaxID=3044051 RepID=UPI002795EAEF